MRISCVHIICTHHVPVSCVHIIGKRGGEEMERRDTARRNAFLNICCLFVFSRFVYVAEVPFVSCFKWIEAVKKRGIFSIVAKFWSIRKNGLGEKRTV